MSQRQVSETRRIAGERGHAGFDAGELPGEMAVRGGELGGEGGEVRRRAAEEAALRLPASRRSGSTPGIVEVAEEAIRLDL